MKDRFVLVGALALLVAALSSAWLFSSRSTPAVAPTAPPVAAAVSQTGVSVVAPTATRAASVDVVVALDGMGGAGAFAQSGDHVAVLGFIPAELNQGSAMTRVLLPDVTVIQGSADSAVTVAVSPEQALFVRSAQSLGVRMFIALQPADGLPSPQMPDEVSERDLRAILRAKSR
jgi:hypothetical protein